MFHTRQRRLAWMFALVLILELALLCCASMHLTDHHCTGDDSCAICACVRSGMRRAALTALLAAAFACAVTLLTGSLSARRFAAETSLVSQKVRLND